MSSASVFVDKLLGLNSPSLKRSLSNNTARAVCGNLHKGFVQRDGGSERVLAKTIVTLSERNMAFSRANVDKVSARFI